MTEVSTLVALSKPSTTVSKTTTTATSGSETLPISDTTDILIGMKVSGTNIATNTIVTAISTNTNITMSKEATASGATGTLTFTRTSFDAPTNPELCVSTTSTSVDTFGVVVAEDTTGTITLTSVGRSTLANCNVVQGSNIVSLSSGNTNGLYAGQSVNGTGFTGTQARIESIISSTEFSLTEKASANATNATYVLGLEHRNLAITEGTRIKCFDDLTSTGIRLNSIDLNTTHLFVLIHSDDENKHHFAKVSELFTDDVSEDSFEFRPKLGDEIAKDVKFKLFSTPISNSITEIAVGLGIKSTLAPSVSLARPLFYFFNENLDKKNELDHNKKYSLFYSELDFISGATDTLSATSFFTTMPDFGTNIVDYGKYTLSARLIDNLKNQDNPATHTSNEGETLLSYTPFSRDACFTNARRDANDTITDTASQDYTGPYRYLSYGFSKDRANLAYNVIDQILYESMGAKGTLAEVKIGDPYRILSKKIGDEEPLRLRHQLFTGNFNEFKSIGAKITSNPSGNTYATTTDHDLGNYLNVGDEVRVGTRIVVVQSIASISGKTQNITFRSENRLESESIFTTGSYTLANDSVLERRAYNPTDNTLLTDFPLVVNRESTLYVKLISKEFNYLYAGVSAIDVNKKLITLSFSDKGYFDSTTKNMLDYMKGQYIILIEKMTGQVERLEYYKDKGLTQVKLAGRSNIRKLISPIISKNTLFSQDIIYSTQSPYNKLTSAGANFTCTFDSKTLTASTSITLSAGTQVHLKYASGMMSYIGEIASTNTGTSFTLVSESRAEGTTLAGYKESIKNYVLNKALATNPFVDSTTSLSGASNKGLFFNSGVKITSTGEEGDILVGSSSSDNENALGYFISDVSNIKSDSPFQAILEDENNNLESFDTINTLLDFEIVGTESAGANNGTFVKVAPYMPLTLGRVDINYANTQDTTFHKDTLGKTLHDITSHARKYIDVDSDLALSAFNHIRGQKNLHDKPIYVNGKFLANIVSVEKNVEIFKSTAVDGTTAATVDTAGLSEGMVLSDNAHVNTKTISQLTSTGIILSSSAGGTSTADTLYSLPSTLARIYVDRDIGLIEEICKLNSNKIISNLDTSNIFVGMKVQDRDGTTTNIPTNTTVVSIDSLTTITISNNANNSNSGIELVFSFGSGIVIDRLEGHHNQDATRETSKLTHEFNLLNAGHLHGAKNIALIHPSVRVGGSYNPTSIVDYRLGGEQPFHEVETTHSVNADSASKLDEFGTYQSNFGASNYRLMNIEKGNYNKSKILYFEGDSTRFYEDIPSKIKYYASAYRYNMGYYTDGFLQNNIIGTDICGMNIIGQGRIGTTSGDPIIDATVEANIVGSTPNTHFDNIFRIGQKITGAGIPDDTFIGNIIGIGDSTSTTIEARLTNLSATAVNATATATNVTAKFFDFDNKRLIESRGYLPSIGDKFYEPNTLETKSETIFDNSLYKQGGTPTIFYTPRPYTELDGSTNNGGAKLRTLHRFKDKFEQIDPKIARMFLFSNSDLLPYSSIRKDSLMNRDIERKINNYSLLTITKPNTTIHSEEKEAVKGKTVSITNLDDSYNNYNIISSRNDKNITELKRFSIMRLTEIVVDCFYNQFDPENIPKKNKNIGLIGFYPKIQMSNVEDSSGNHLSISSVSNKVINTVRADTGAAATADIVAKDIIVDRAGRFIGVVASVGSNAITLTANACRTDLAVDSTGDFYAPRLNNQAGGSPNGEFMKLFYIPQAYFEQGQRRTDIVGVVSNGSPTMTGVDTTNLFVGMRIDGSGVTNPANASYIYRIKSIDSATQLTMTVNATTPSGGTQTYTFTNYYGAGVLKGYNTENNFVEADGTINLLQMATMRGLASDGTGYPNDYVRNSTTQSSSQGANRGDNDAGYGGNNSTHTDTTFATAKGVNAIAGQVINRHEDCAMVLPFVAQGAQGYYSWLGRSFFNNLDYFGGNYHSDNDNIISKQMFPLLGEYLHQPTTAQHQTGEGNFVIQGNYSNSEGRGNANNRRMLQNHIPVFLERWGIAGGTGGKTDVGMTATKITNTRGIHVEGTDTDQKEVRIGLALGTIWSGNNSLTTSGFVSKTVSTDAVYAASNPTYDNDADGVFGGFKPTLKIDTGFNADATFTTGGSTDGRFEADNNDILDQHGVSGSAKMHLYVNSDKVPKFTRTTEVNETPTPDQVSMNANATSAGTESVRFSRNFAGSEIATNGNLVHTLVFPDFRIEGQANTMNAHWLSFVDLTGCYLVSEEVKRHLDNTSSAETESFIVEDYETAGDYGLGGSHGLGSSPNIQALRNSMDLGTPKYMLYVISHEIDTTSPERKHILTVSGTFPSAASSRTASTRFKTFRIMQPNHTCFYNYSPTDIRINQVSSRYTKKPSEDAMYDTINHFHYKEQLGSKVDEGNNEGVLSMYVIVDTDGASKTTRTCSTSNNSATLTFVSSSVTTDLYVGMAIEGTGIPIGTTIATINSTTQVTMSKEATASNNPITLTFYESNLVVSNPLALRNNIMSVEKIEMNLSDGDNNNLTTVSFTDIGDDIGFEFTLETQKELLGVVSMSETIDLLVNNETAVVGKRALIGSAVSVAQDADKLINQLLEENDIEVDVAQDAYPFITAPTYRGVDLFSAINFLMNKKNKILIEENGIIKIEENRGANFFPNIVFSTLNTDTQIYTYTREKSMFDFYNEIIVFGKTHRAVRKELNSIKKKGKKTLQVFENELVTQNDVDKRAGELLKIHNDKSFGLKLNVGHKGISHLRVGDVVTVEIPQENIPRSEFIVIEIQHNLAGTLDLELGSYSKGLEDRFAELAIGNRAVNNKIREGSFNDSQLNFDFLEKIKIKPIKILARKKSVSAGGFTLGTSSDTSETLNTNTNALNIGTTTFTTLVEEEF